MNYKATIIKISVLLILLAVFTLLYARQDVVMRVVLDEETFIRNGQQMRMHFRMGTDDWHIVDGETEFRSIYEYKFNVPSRVWSKTSQVKLELDGVRRSDSVYIESLSVNKPFFREYKADNAHIYESISNISGFITDISGSNQLAFTVVTTEPYFALPIEIIYESDGLSFDYTLIFMSICLLWAAIVFFLPRKVYVSYAIKDSGGITVKYNMPKWLPYIAILLLGLIVYVPAIFPNPYYWSDEFFGRNAANSLLWYGHFDGYDRAWQYTWLLAQVIKVFGDTTVATRGLSAFFGVVFIVSAFHITKKMTKRTDVAVLTSVFLLSSHLLTDIFAMVRMYAPLMVTSLWMFYCVYQALHLEIAYKSDNVITRFMKSRFSFHWGYAAAAIGLMYITYQLHINTLILIPCAAVYVFIKAIVALFRKNNGLTDEELYEKRRYIYLSVIGLLIIGIAIIARYFSFEIPYISQLLRSFLWRTTILQEQVHEYFIQSIEIPFGLYIGIFFILANLLYIRKNSGNKHINIKRSVIVFCMISYLLSISYFVFSVETIYYGYRYIAFLAPITMMLLATGIHAFSGFLLNAHTRAALFALVGASIALQIIGTFSYTYIDKPDRSKWSRPYQILQNDARNEGIENIEAFTRSARYWYEWGIGKDLGRVEGEFQIDDNILGKIEEPIEQPVKYFIGEGRIMSTVFHNEHGRFLNEAAELLSDTDAVWIFKYHFIEPERLTLTDDIEITHGVSITSARWEADVAYLGCEMSYIPEFSGAKFIAVEVAEQGHAQNAKPSITTTQTVKQSAEQTAFHRYQVLVPDGFSNGDMLVFTLPVRPKTTEYCENITFNMVNQSYIYYGQNVAEVIKFD